MQPPPPSLLRAILVAVGEDGLYAPIQSPELILALCRSSLVRALSQDVQFQDELLGVTLNKCAVTVCASASETKPTKAEVAASRELEGAITLSRLAAGMPVAAGGGP